MSFNSLHYAFFLALITILYYTFPYRFRWVLLLAGSYFFYSYYRIEFGAILLASTTFNYLIALGIAHAQSNFRKKLLYFYIIGNISILIYFKYRLFFFQLLPLDKNDFPVSFFNLILPLGISFFTFQAIGYGVDVYKNKIKPEKHFGYFALFMSFFPQLVAGPIEKAQNLLPQFRKQYFFNYDQCRTGLLLILWGIFQKCVIADRLGLYVDSVYDSPDSYSGLPIILATVFYSFQIFCDFSGYIDIARGSALLLGFNLMHNFNKPFFATSIIDYWQRWHISLSVWLKEYIYFPLGGSRLGETRKYLNLMAVFLISGLWHGSNWTFIIWGALHGLGFILTLQFRKITCFKNLSLLKYSFVISIPTTFILIAFTRLFFRANTLTDSFTLLKQSIQITPNFLGINILGKNHLIISCLLILVLLIIHKTGEKRSIKQWIISRPDWQRWGLYYIFIFITFTLGVWGNKQFIYFKF